MATAAAAFFDLDRTLLRRSSVLALAGSFQERGVISRWQLAKSALWQLLFVMRGASAEAIRTAAEDGMMLLKGFTVEEMRARFRPPRISVLFVGESPPVAGVFFYSGKTQMGRG